MPRRPALYITERSFTLVGVIQLYIAASLDGFVADVDGGFDWLDPYNGDDDHGYGEFIEGVGALVMGADTYELFFGPLRDVSWPYGARPTWVFTHRSFAVVPGADVRFVSGDVRSVAEEVRASAGGLDVWLVGGGDLVAQFLDAGLLDVVRLFVIPVALGAGIPLWRGPIPGALELVEVSGYEDGVAELRYEVARDPANGAHAGDADADGVDGIPGAAGS